jgi:anaerobic selenocysteine-containing dehydrogenase
VKRVTRRTLLQLAQAGAVATAAGALEFTDGPLAQGRTVRGTCRMCTMHCGIVATVEGDRLARVEGDPDSKTRGFLCHHGWALREVVHAPDRLQQPRQRLGGQEREVTWDAALDGIAASLQRIRAEHGPEALAVQTGWPFVRHPLVPLLQRFCTAWGSPNLVTVASLCESASRMGKALVAGADLTPDLKGARSVLVWGGNPLTTAPPFAHLLAQKAHDGHHLIVVDPTRTELARVSSLHLQPRPGTDGALALGMLNVAIAERRYDPAFVAQETVGFEELAALAAQYPAEVAAQITGVPPDRLRAAVRLFAEGPGTIWDGLGLEHHANGVQTIRAVTSLAALLGYVDVPGGLTLKSRPEAGFWEEPLPQLYRLATPEPIPPPPAAKPLGYEDYPLFHVYNRQAQGMLLPDAILEDRPYPVRALICLGSNPAVTYPDSQRMHRALAKLDLLVVIDPFPTATAAAAHWVLPAATFAEASSVAAGGESSEVARSGLVPEQHASWPDWKIVFALARRLGLGSYFPWATLAEAVQAPRRPYLPDHDREPRPTATSRTDLPRFPTPSGKLELTSALAARYGAPRRPEWSPAAEQPSPDYPLFLITGPRGRRFINSQFRTIPSLRSRSPSPRAELHPATAARLGIGAGERVRVVSPRGSIEMELELSPHVHPECVVVPAGWESANANLLSTAATLDPLSGFPALRSGVARLEKLAGRPFVAGVSGPELP